MSVQLEQIARIVHEQGYWKPREHVPNYHRQDVYHLGQSAQRLFDDYAGLDRRVEQVHASKAVEGKEKVTMATDPAERGEKRSR